MWNYRQRQEISSHISSSQVISREKGRFNFRLGAHGVNVIENVTRRGRENASAEENVAALNKPKKENVSVNSKV